MAFKSLSTKLKSRLGYLELKKSKNLIIKEVIKGFLEENYNKKIANSCDFNYDPAQDFIFISTKSKPLANELLLNLTYIMSLLSLKNIRVKRVIIR